MIKAALVVVVIWVIVIGAIVYTAVHFVSKFW